MRQILNLPLPTHMLHARLSYIHGLATVILDLMLRF